LLEELTSIIDYVLTMLAVAIVMFILYCRLRNVHMFIRAQAVVFKFSAKLLRAIIAVNKQHEEDMKDPELRNRFYISKENDLKQKAWLKKIDDFVKAQDLKKSKAEGEKKQ
jgi:hypothetical protein